MADALATELLIRFTGVILAVGCGVGALLAATDRRWLTGAALAIALVAVPATAGAIADGITGAGWAPALRSAAALAIPAWLLYEDRDHFDPVR
ncbi:hypothetical protein [Euzebya pacifica]|uniref:hypothetical protein n=1 Tax=Euzebya pacifica TaxID=1608957 RepID=UPI000DF818FA|nr:hypothetical protein [Euzebya pacifica]